MTGVQDDEMPNDKQHKQLSKLTETDIELHTQLCTYYVLVIQCPHLGTIGSEIVDLVEDDQPWCLTQPLAVHCNGSQLQNIVAW